MKITLPVLLSLLLFCSVAKAQKIHFSDTTNVWRGVHIDGSSPNPTQTLTSAYTFQHVYDTTINGRDYDIIGSGQILAAIREDTFQKKVYFRFVTAGIRSYAADTLEHVLYDYNLQVNDTFSMDNGGLHYFGVVYAIDSTLINGQYHKVWHFSSGLSPNQFGNLTLGTVIEGIGNTENPLWPVSFVIFEDFYQLQCFSNRDGNPAITPAVRLPYYASVPWFGPPTTDYFDNTTSCSLAVVDPISEQKRVTIYPNPGSTDIILNIIKPIQKGKLVVYNSIGQTIVQMSLNNTSVVKLGALIQVPGIYYYSVIDEKMTKTYKGNFVYR